MKLKFSIRSLLVLTVLTALAIAFWPRPQVPGDPNLVGTITDLQGRPVSGVKVKLYSGVATRWLSQESETDASGNYSFRPLKSGAIVFNQADDEPSYLMVGIQIEHPNYMSADGKSWWDESIPAIKSYTRRVDFKLKPVNLQETPLVENNDD